MPIYVSLRFNSAKPYIPDWATAAAADSQFRLFGAAKYRIPTIGGAFLARTILDTINEQSGAAVYKIGDEIIDASLGNIPCQVGGGVDFRRLVFISDVGQSISVPISERANLASASNTIKTALNGGGFNVVCVKLVGEEYNSVNDIFNVNTTDATVANPDPPTSGRGSYYSGQIIYQSDTGNNSPTAVKILSNNKTTGAPSALTASWTSCVGAFANIKSCGGVGSRKHRRFIADFQITGGGLSSREIPIKNRSASDVNACGSAIVTELGGALVCLRYKGESYDLFNSVAAPTP